MRRGGWREGREDEKGRLEGGEGRGEREGEGRDGWGGRGDERGGVGERNL